MKTNYFFKTFLLVFLYGLNVKAQVSVTQGFESNPFLPTGWQLNPAGTGGPGGTPNYWAGTTGTGGGNNPAVTPHGGTKVARFRANNNLAGVHQSLITAPIDYTGLGNNIAHFSFWMYRDTALANKFDSLAILVSTDTVLGNAIRIGSVIRNCTIAQPDTAAPNTWNQYTFYVPQSFVGDTNYIILCGYGDAGRNIYIDDIEYDTYPAICNGQPSIGTLAASSYLLCGGAGVSHLQLTGSNYGESGISIQWQMSATGTAPWTDTLMNAITMSTDTISMPMYYRVYIDCNASGLSDTSSVVFIDVSTNPLPTLTIAPTGTGPQLNQISYCLGTPGVMVSATGATTYTWGPAAGLNQTSGDSVLANPTIQTTYTIVGTDASGCTASKTFVILPRNPPNFTISAISDTICNGNSATLIAAGFGNYSYAWEPGSLTGNTITVNPTTNTNYFVTATSNTSGCTKTDTLNIVVVAGANADFSFTINDTTVTFSSTITNATLVSWSFGDGGNSTNTNPTHSFADSGAYVVKMIIATPCGNDTISKTVTISKGSGIEEIQNTESIQLFPNPASSEIMFTALSAKNLDAKVYAVNGKEVLNTNINNFSKGIVHIDISNLNRGFYILKLNENNQKYKVGYFVKE